MPDRNLTDRNLADRNLAFFQKMYTSEAEPFAYSTRAVELYRHDLIVEIVSNYQPNTVLEIGCSLGLLTRRLPGIVTAIDLSPIAATRANGAAANVMALPFPDESFDVVLAADGPNSWFLNEEELAVAFGEMHRVVKRGGHVVITDYEKPRNFDSFIARIERSQLEIENVHYIHDRLWYKAERALPFIKGNRTLARLALSASRAAGRISANHVLVETSRAAR